MKKVIFAVLTAFVMSLGFASCSSSSPQDKILDSMDELVTLMKKTHIKSADDVKVLKEKAEAIKKDVETAMEQLTKDKSPEELLKLATELKDFEKKTEELSKTGDAEIERLKKEAEAAGVDVDALDFLD